MPTISDVAALAGTSRATVSFVFNGRKSVSGPTRARVVEAARQLDWTPNRRAQSLSTSRAYAVGVVLARHPETLASDPFFAPFIAGVEASLSAAHQSLLLRICPDPADEEQAYRAMRKQRSVDGVILTDIRHDDSRVGLLHALGLPAVTLNGPPGSPLADVTVDDERGVHQAVEHVVARGHRRIGYAGGPETYLHSTRRRLAWRSALRGYGLDASSWVETDFSSAGGARATEQLLGTRPAPTAILYANDSMAIAGMMAARRAGVRVPEDLAVVGYEDSELSAHVIPALTTVHSDAFAWGREAAGALLGLVATGHAHAPLLPPTELVIRDSVLRGPGADEGSDDALAQQGARNR